MRGFLFLSRCCYNLDKMTKQKSQLSPFTRTSISISILILATLLLLFVGEGLEDSGAVIPFFLSIGLVSWLLGLRWYGLPAMGLRGGRPLFSSIGFATLPWVGLLLARFLVRINPEAYTAQTASTFQTFAFILLFEAFCVQLWAFGLTFHSIADWQNPLTAALASGILFGGVAFLTFQEAYLGLWSAIIYFALWGITYGIIRLRTGSLIGIVILQALQTFTVWFVLPADFNVSPVELNQFYLVGSILFMIIIWRLWPKQEEDYRV